jgi:predicted dehydrogenase
MKERKIGIIMNGVTGRMGTNQHLVRSILAIRKPGGIKINGDEVIMPVPILVGRNENKLKALAAEHGLDNWSTDLDACLKNDEYQIYFDAQTTALRAQSIRKAIKAGKAIYCEKPIAENFDDALAVCREVQASGLKNGVVQDKLWLPGLVKLKQLIDSGFFGRILSVRGEFGYWVFDGKDVSCQRPSWNYRKEDGGGLVVDMLCHWRYVIDNLFGNICSVSCLATTHIDKRWDEGGKPYDCTADDSAYSTFMLDNGIVCHFNSSWATRVYREDLLRIQVDGTEGSAMAGLTKCLIQSLSTTPRYVWNPDEENGYDFRAEWQEFSRNGEYENAFKIQWELFLRHVVLDEPFRWNLMEGVKGLQLAEKALESSVNKCWVTLEDLK